MGKTFVCFCEDVTVEDVERAIRLGYDDLESLKRYTTALTGFCQGKTCQAALVELLRKHRGQAVSKPTTARAPVHPTPLKFFCGGEGS